MAYGAERYLSKGSLRYKQGHKKPGTFVTRHTILSLGIKPLVVNHRDFDMYIRAPCVFPQLRRSAYPMKAPVKIAVVIY
jgi:hypothetical protein